MMPEWVVISIIVTVCTAAFLGAVVGVLLAKMVVHKAQKRDAARCARSPASNDAAQRVLDLARTLSVSVSAIDDDLRGRRHG